MSVAKKEKEPMTRLEIRLPKSTKQKLRIAYCNDVRSILYDIIRNRLAKPIWGYCKKPIYGEQPRVAIGELSQLHRLCLYGYPSRENVTTHWL